MNHLAFFIENDKYRESEATTVIQAFHKPFSLLQILCSLRLTRIVVHMDILKIVFNDLADRRIIRNKISKP